MEKKNDVEFDLIELLLYMKKRIWIVALTVFIFAAGGYLASKMMMTPEYTATAQVLIVYDVHSDEGNMTQEEYTNNLMASQIRRDCEVLLKSRTVSAPVIENLGLNMSPGGLGSSVNVEPVENTHVLNLSFVDTNPERAARILNEFCDVGRSKVHEMLGEDVLRVVDYAEVPGAPSSPSASRNATVAAILGLVAAVSIMIIIFLMDDSIRTEYDMEHYLGLSTLAEIPVSDELNLSRKGNEISYIRGKIRKNGR